MNRTTWILPLVASMLLTLVPAGQTSAEAVGRARVRRCNGCWPAAFAFTPDGRFLFYAERFTGIIHRFDMKKRKDRRWGRIRGVSTSGEQGVLGLATDPAWRKGRKKRWVYAYYTDSNPVVNRIIRLRKRRGGGLRRGRLARIPASSIHNGGVIHFGPDRLLYAVTGDAASPSRSQAKGDLAGKVLRMRRNGKRPASNPFAGSRAWSYGHRNSFGFGFDPETGRLWQTENGPQCNDEINLIQKGGNYGWGPSAGCPNTNNSGPNPIAPKRNYSSVIAPTGLAFCVGCRLGGGSEGDLFHGDYINGRIRRYNLNGARTEISGETVVFDGPLGILAMERAPNGRLFFSDRNGIYRLR